MTASKQIKVRVLKYDGSEYRRWNARMARLEGSLIVLEAEFEFDVQHDSLGTIPKGTQTVEYYWLDRWYNVFRFVEDDNSTRLWYCNVSTPATVADAMLSYVDLDIDMLVQPDLTYALLDLDDFEENAQRFGYSVETQQMAHQAVDELRVLIDTHQFPFTP
jgi:protein associated with RNAse G/E